MLTLTLRTDNPLAEIGLYEDDKKLAYERWEAHRQLAETLHSRVRDILQSQQKDWADIQGIICYQGPGSFTGLRIGLSVANALAASLPAKIIATTGDSWITDGLEQLAVGLDQQVTLPEYGAPVHITQQRK